MRNSSLFDLVLSLQERCQVTRYLFPSGVANDNEGLLVETARLAQTLEQRKMF